MRLLQLHEKPRYLLKSPLTRLCLYKYLLLVARGPVLRNNILFWHTFRVHVELLPHL